MLEIRNIVKIYRTKGGVEVRALDGVSAAFPEKGMVFLLGKSGSGKSTLLNVCGGLDVPDSGEIIIKGRSSKNFTQSDFDSYRNTFVGFVFQEYNILNEFTVEDNIALALELQGKGKERAQVQHILEQVDMTEFAKRKPNTLSGGQKQRVAIARALVKNPEIIMADEPTGALDSATGRQVLDTLKKLSADKLVIVVSHDREFAAQYGDRIIELQDGKIISDETKEKVAATPAGDNISFVGDNTIAIKSGSALTPGDVERINDFLRSSPKDLIISCGEREIADFKKAARIDDSGARERFRDTTAADVAAKDYSPQDSTFIRSRLPMRHAIRIGASSMKVKPLRLFFTILLSFISFALFGLFSTLTFYDPVATAAQNYMDLDLAGAKVRLMYTYDNVNYDLNGNEIYRYSSSKYTAFTQDQLDEMREKYGNEALGFINYASEDSYSVTSLYVSNANYVSSNYYTTNLCAFATFVPEAWQDRMLTDTDLSALGDEEIVISSYTFDSLLDAGIQDENGEEVAFSSYDDIVGKKLEICTSNLSNLKWLTIAGVYENDFPERFDEIKSPTILDENYNGLYSEFVRERTYGAYNAALVSDGFYTANASTYAPFYEYYGFTRLSNYYQAVPDDAGDLYEDSFNYASYLPRDDGRDVPPISLFDGRTDSALNNGEIIVNISLLKSYIIDHALNNYYDKLYSLAEELLPTDPEQARSLYELANQTYADIPAAMEILINGEYSVYEYDEFGNIIGMKYVDATEEELTKAAQDVTDFVNNYLTMEGKEALNYTIYGGWDKNTYSVAGFYYGNTYYYNGIYLSHDDYETVVNSDSRYQRKETDYVRPADAIYDYIYITMPDNYGMLYELSSGAAAATEDGTYTVLETRISDLLDSVNSMIEILSEVFLWVGLVMAIFAMLLLFNFISVSITYKKNEIGILRAVGARSADVFKIFYSEAAIITIICYILAMIASFATCALINSQIGYELGVTILVFGPLSWLVMLGIAVLTSVIATFLPVYSIAKRRPVESIRAL